MKQTLKILATLPVYKDLKQVKYYFSMCGCVWCVMNVAWVYVYLLVWVDVVLNPPLFTKAQKSLFQLFWRAIFLKKPSVSKVCALGILYGINYSLESYEWWRYKLQSSCLCNKRARVWVIAYLRLMSWLSNTESLIQWTKVIFFIHCHQLYQWAKSRPDLKLFL